MTGSTNGMATEADKLLGFSKKLDLTLLDNVLGSIYNGNPEQVRYIAKNLKSW